MCNDKHYKQIQFDTSANSENLQSLPIQTDNFRNLRDKKLLSVQEAAILLGADRFLFSIL